MRDTLTIVGATVTVEPGALVCLGPGSVIVVARATLRAVGTPEKPIRFTATDPARPWDRIKFGALIDGLPGGTGVFTDVLFELASYGIEVWQPSDVTIERSRFRQMQNGAIHDDIGGSNSGGASRLIVRNSVIDTAGNVRIAKGVFENSVIRGGGGLILSAAARFGRSVDVLGGRIEGSTVVAVKQEVSGPYGEDGVVGEIRPLRIIGSRGKLVSMRAGLFQQMWPPSQQDSLLGNPDGVIELFAHFQINALPRTSSGLALVLRRDLTWQFNPSNCNSNACFWLPVDDFVLEPGTNVQINGVELQVFRRFSAPGTAERPISIAAPASTSCFYSCGGIRLLGTSEASSASYVTLTNAYLKTGASHAVTLSRINSNAEVALESTGSSIVDSDLHDMHSFPASPDAQSPAAPLRLGAGARMERTTVRGSQFIGVIVTGPGVTLQSCDVTGNAGDGIRVITDGTNVRVRDCNIQGNHGVGLNNTTTQTIDARGNWWGDPAGPNGPNGNRVSGNVDFSGWLTQPRAPLGPTSRF